MKCDVLLGQDWLERFGYEFWMLPLSMTFSAYLETVVRVSTTEKGYRLVEAHELQEKVFCTFGVVECKDFISLLNDKFKFYRWNFKDVSMNPKFIEAKWQISRGDE